MIKKIRNALVAVAALFAFSVPVAVPAVVFAQDDLIQDGLCSGVNLETTGGDCDPDTAGTTDRLNSLLRQIINIFSIIVGVIAVIMIIIGGLKYITSGGDSGNISGAKNTIIYALVGLVIVALAQFIVRFVLGKASGLA
jgi:hypothetical protein